MDNLTAKMKKKKEKLMENQIKINAKHLQEKLDISISAQCGNRSLSEHVALLNTPHFKLSWQKHSWVSCCETCSLLQLLLSKLQKH